MYPRDGASDFEILSAPFFPNSTNLEIAKTNGVMPLSMNDLFAQLSPHDMQRAVFFDTSLGPGNHWRLVSDQDNTDHPVVQFCLTFGNHDYSVFDPVSIDPNDPCFTEVSIHSYRLDNTTEDLTLSEVTKLVANSINNTKEYPEGLKHSETILWSSRAGILTIQQPKFDKLP